MSKFGIIEFSLSIVDEQIYDILKEEAVSFFGDAKSAVEADDIAANRIGIYINELR